MRFSHSSLLLIASLASSTLAQSEVDLEKLDTDPHCVKCFGAMPCMKNVSVGGNMPEDEIELYQCVCQESVFAVFESDCSKCPLLKQDGPEPTLADFKKDCATSLPSSSPNTTSSTPSSNTASSLPSSSTNGSSSKYLLSFGMVTIAALAAILLA
ncbi:hypothetical protein K7432_003203 [Basidiobolus ranarum]|uniref:Uncharacterized protein n=1 Tax=Basidiobolus ranarum TaxID=34480 RepID=A0ABR2W6P6_9FUNG